MSNEIESKINEHIAGETKASREEVPEDAFCWICHDEKKSLGPDHEGNAQAPESLRRDCACRGSSGFAHWSCLVKYAMERVQYVGNSGDSTQAWRTCPLCKQGYQNDHRISMAEAFVQFCEQIDDIDPFRYGEALYTKLLALDKDPKEQKKTAHEMISCLQKCDAPSTCTWASNPVTHSDQCKNLMSLAYEKLGYIHLKVSC